MPKIANLKARPLELVLGNNVTLTLGANEARAVTEKQAEAAHVRECVQAGLCVVREDKTPAPKTKIDTSDKKGVASHG